MNQKKLRYYSPEPFDANCCHMGTAIEKQPVPDRVKQSSVILTSGHSDAQPWSSECPDVKNYRWRLNPVWHRLLLHSCTNMATVGVKGLNLNLQHRTVDIVKLIVSRG